MTADTQEHALSCTVLMSHLTSEEQQMINNISYSDLFGDCKAQSVITKLYIRIIEIRKRLQDADCQDPANLRHISGPSG